MRHRQNELLTPLRLGGYGQIHDADAGGVLTGQRAILEPPPSTSAVTDDYRGGGSLLGTIRFLFLSVAALRVQQATVVPPPVLVQSLPHVSTPLTTGSERPINVLCLDGGGMKGRNLMVMIAEIEEACGRPVSEMFDLIAGTSIGGCGALFLSKFKDEATSKARDAFASLGSTCLQHQSIGRLVSHGYLCQDQRPTFLRDLVGSQTLSSDGPRAFAVASREGKHGLEPYLFRTYDCGSADSGDGGADVDGGGGVGSDAEGGAVAASSEPTALPGTSAAQLWEAVVATSAAPLFFPRAHFGGERFADGGLVANDPTLIAVREAATLWPRRALGLVVSLGTGAPDDAEASDVDSGSNTGGPPAWQRLLPRALKPMTDALLRGLGCADDPNAAQRVAECVQHAAPGARYYRLQPHLPERIGPFESDEAKLVAMEEHTRNHFRQSSLAAELCSRLVESVRPQETVRDLNAMVPFRVGAEKMGKRTAVVEEPGVPSSFVEPRCFVELEQDGQ